MDVSERKKEIRQWMEKRRRDVSPAEREMPAAEIAARLAEFAEWREAHALAAYWPLEGEMDVRPALRAWISQDASGRFLALPKVQNKRPPSLSFHEATAMEEVLIRGPLGVLQPDADRCPVVAVDLLDWIWVPGVAFDRAGRRLGRGGGYYDATLSRLRPRTVTVGLAWHWQVFSEPLPEQEWDQRLDWIVTDRETIRCAPECS